MVPLGQSDCFLQQVQEDQIHCEAQGPVAVAVVAAVAVFPVEEASVAAQTRTATPAMETGTALETKTTGVAPVMETGLATTNPSGTASLHLQEANKSRGKRRQD